MVYGLWFMVYGLWFMVYGLWLRLKDYDVRFMVYGLWFTVLHALPHLHAGGQLCKLCPRRFPSLRPTLGFGVWGLGFGV